MSGDRAALLAAVRRSLRPAEPEERRKAALEARLARPQAGPVPARALLEPAARTELFVAMAEEAAATLRRLPGPAAVPEAVAAYLAGENLPARLRIAPDPLLQALPWQARPLLSVSAGATRGEDPVSLSRAFAGIAETGTLALLSGPAGPTTLNFLPDTHIVLLETARILGAFEELWPLIRAREGPGRMPRSLNLVTGPSRSADIEQTLQMGAHGPRRLHILLVDGEAAP